MLGMQIFDTPSKAIMLWDFSPRAQDVTATTNDHGFASLTCFVPMTLAESFQVYDRPGLPHVVLSSNSAVIWEGRLEDVAIVNGGVRLGAYGYQRAMSDVPYTALWSVTSVAGWESVPNSEIVGRSPDMYGIDTNNRLYIGLQKNAVYGSFSNVGMLGYKGVDNGDRAIVAASFDYDILLPANWRLVFGVATDTWTRSDICTINTTGSAQTGSTAITFSGTARDWAYFQIYNTTSPYTYTGESGSLYALITNPHLKTTTSGSVIASEIAGGLVTYISGINSTQIDTSTVLIESPGIDLNNELYEDESPSDILNSLAKIGDNQTPPRLWEWGVYENRQLHFRPRGSQARAWYVDASAVEIERTIDQLTNSVYAVYQDANGETIRTAVSTDTDSVARYGLTRRGKVEANTTSGTQAAIYRDAALADSKDPIPRSGIVFERLYDAAGGLVPLWMCRSGDTITIRNLPPSLSTAVDRIRTFRVSETSYDVDNDLLSVTPESPTPSLQTLDAQRAARSVK